MSVIKYDIDSFVASLEPGITSFVVSKFKNRLEEKIQNAMKEVYVEMEKELPSEIKTKVEKSFKLETGSNEVNVIIDLRNNNN